MPKTVTRNPSQASIELAKKIHGTKAVLDALNELDRIRDTIKLISRRGNLEAFTMLEPLAKRYDQIFYKYFGV